MLYLFLLFCVCLLHLKSPCSVWYTSCFTVVLCVYCTWSHLVLCDTDFAYSCTVCLLHLKSPCRRTMWYTSCCHVKKLQLGLLYFNSINELLINVWFSDSYWNIYWTMFQIIFSQLIGGKTTNPPETGFNSVPRSNVHVRDGYSTLQHQRDKTRPLTLHITQPSTSAGTLRLYLYFLPFNCSSY